MVRVQVTLSGREAGSLFLNGDSLIHLPLEGALPDAESTPIPRVGIYLSELAASREGITRAFADDAAAEQYAATVRRQLETALEASS